MLAVREQEEVAQMVTVKVVVVESGCSFLYFLQPTCTSEGPAFQKHFSLRYFQNYGSAFQPLPPKPHRN